MPINFTNYFLRKLLFLDEINVLLVISSEDMIFQINVPHFLCLFLSSIDICLRKYLSLIDMRFKDIITN